MDADKGPGPELLIADWEALGIPEDDDAEPAELTVEHIYGPEDHPADDDGQEGG
jgi:hypothetical protein